MLQLEAEKFFDEVVMKMYPSWKEGDFLRSVWVDTVWKKDFGLCVTALKNAYADSAYNAKPNLKKFRVQYSLIAPTVKTENTQMDTDMFLLYCGGGHSNLNVGYIFPFHPGSRARGKIPDATGYRSTTVRKRCGSERNTCFLFSV